jgi:uridylate kinase
VSRRVLLKLSGEVLGGEAGSGLDPGSFTAVASTVAPAVRAGVEVAIVIGGGNLCRGGALDAPAVPRTTADTAGMLATVMNGLLLNASFAAAGLQSEVYSPWPTGGETAPYSARAVRQHLSGAGVAVLAGGTGSPFFTTDTTAALRALELDCEEVLKGTKVDGVYSADPARDPSAVRFDRVSFTEVLERGLGVMDAAAVALCREHGLPIRVFSMIEEGGLRGALLGEAVGTLVEPES